MSSTLDSFLQKKSLLFRIASKDDPSGAPKREEQEKDGYCQHQKKSNVFASK
jgi:hypothetical protein